jgi:chromosome condensin MukBEF MukE localization factor
MATAKQVELSEFYERFTRIRGRGTKKYFELKEVKTRYGLDCIFLDREAIVGKAVCSLYSSVRNSIVYIHSLLKCLKNYRDLINARGGRFGRKSSKMNRVGTMRKLSVLE